MLSGGDKGRRKKYGRSERGGEMAEGGKIRLLLVLRHVVERGARLEPGQLPLVERMAERDVLGRSAMV